MRILKLNHVVFLYRNCMFVLKKLRSEQPTTFPNFFKVSNNEHNHNARGIKTIKSTVKRTNYSLNSIKCKSAD